MARGGRAFVCLYELWPISIMWCFFYAMQSGWWECFTLLFHWPTYKPGQSWQNTFTHTHTHSNTHTHTHTQIQAHRHTRRHTHTVYCSHNLPTHIYAIPRTCLLLSLFVLRTHAIPRTCIPLPPFFNLNACNLPLSIFVLQTHTIPRIASPLFHAHTHTRTHSRTQSAPLIMCATHTGNFKDVHASSCHGPPSNPPPGHPAYLKSMSVGSNTSGTSR